jgi:peptidoglycan-N-acetylglucosamine deacetylase
MAHPRPQGSAQGGGIVKNFLGLSLVAMGLAFLAVLAGAERGLAAAAEPICRGDGLKKQVALTFDDGPDPDYTLQILGLLEKYAARATFFVLGEHVQCYPEIVRKLVNSGQEVGNHSFTHPRFPAEAQEAWHRELKHTELELDLLGCPDQHLFRPPFSDYNQELLGFLAHIDQRLILWSVDGADWREPDPLAIAVNVLSQVRPGAIVILHDSDETGTADRTPTVEALGLILPALKARGYEFVTVSELLGPPGEPDQERAAAGP